jgi:hypothetical protein
MQEPNFEACIVPIEWVKKMTEDRRKVNRMDLTKITWTENGKPIQIPSKIIEDWKFTGLNNTDFIGDDFYLTGFTEE